MADQKILLAYCRQLDRIVDIDEARRVFFDQNQSSEFTFECSDRNCGSKISAVNYQAIDFIKMPHYRRINAHPHDPECYWNFYEEDHRQDEEEIKAGTLLWEPGTTNYLKQFMRADHRDIIDRFVLRANTEEIITPPPRRRLTSDRQRTLRNYKQVTMAFYRLVEAFRQLTDAEKTYTVLELPDGSGRFQCLAYRQAFVHVKTLRPGKPDAKVFYGSARVERHRDGYLIKFRNKAPKFASDLPNIQAAVYIDPDIEN